MKGAATAGDSYDGNRVKQGVRQAGDQIGRARAGRRDTHPGFTGCSRITNGRHGCPLLMPAQQVLHAAVIQCIVNRHNCATRIAKNCVDSLCPQSMYHPLRAIHS